MSDFLREVADLSDSPIRKELRAFAAINNIHILLPESAAFLELVTQMIQPKNILEIGTAIGYSGLLMLENSSEDARLFTIEIDESTLEVAKDFFVKAGVNRRVTTHLEDARAVVPMLSGCFDLIFMDGPKSSYIELLPYLIKLLKKGGVLVCDNVLYKGWITGENEPPNRKHCTIIRKLSAFCREISDSPMLKTSILPIGDGVSLSKKIHD